MVAERYCNEILMKLIIWEKLVRNVSILYQVWVAWPASDSHRSKWWWKFGSWCGQAVGSIWTPKFKRLKIDIHWINSHSEPTRNDEEPGSALESRACRTILAEGTPQIGVILKKAWGFRTHISTWHAEVGLQGRKVATCHTMSAPVESL